MARAEAVNMQYQPHHIMDSHLIYTYVSPTFRI